MRGERKFNDELNGQKDNNKSKGRNKQLILERNSAILQRFYYYSSFTELKYEKIILIISKELFLSDSTTIQIIEKNYNQLKAIKKEQPGLSVLKKSFPQFNWDLKELKLLMYG